MKNQQGVQLARRLLLVQTLLIILLAIPLLFWFGKETAWSAVFGGLACSVPNILFARIFFKEQRVSRAKQIASRFYRAEVSKLLLAIVLFVLAFKVMHVVPLAFFAMYFLVQMTSWVLLLK